MLQESRDQPIRTTCGSGSVEGRCFTEISSLIWGQRIRGLRTVAWRLVDYKAIQEDSTKALKKSAVALAAGEKVLRPLGRACGRAQESTWPQRQAL